MLGSNGAKCGAPRFAPLCPNSLFSEPTEAERSRHPVRLNVVTNGRLFVARVHPPRSLRDLGFCFRCACMLPHVLCPRGYQHFSPKCVGIFQALVDPEKKCAIPQKDQPEFDISGASEPRRPQSTLNCHPKYSPLNPVWGLARRSVHCQIRQASAGLPLFVWVAPSGLLQSLFRCLDGLADLLGLFKRWSRSRANYPRESLQSAIIPALIAYSRRSDVDLIRIRWPFNTLPLAHWRYATERLYDIDTVRANIK